MIPARFLTNPSTGDKERRLAGFLLREDPLADAVVDALTPFSRAEQEVLVSRMLSLDPGPLPGPLATMHAWLRDVPLWFDVEHGNIGGEVLLRNGLLAGLVLAFKSLVLGYCSPAGNKPLLLTGRLTGPEVNRRLTETARFVEAVSQPGGVSFGAPGFIATVRVRLIHARVRQGLRRSAKWRAAEWGAPINQYDMAGTVLLFSAILIEGLRQLGVSVSEREEAANLHLWRYVGRVMGVEDELLCTSTAEAQRLGTMIETSQGLPDLDSRKLTDALIFSGVDRGEPPVTIAFNYAVTRHLVGVRYADALQLPRSGWELAPKVLKLVVGRVDQATRYVPGARAGVLRVGERFWRHTIELVLGAKEVPFELPT